MTTDLFAEFIVGEILDFGTVTYEDACNKSIRILKLVKKRQKNQDEILFYEKVIMKIMEMRMHDANDQ